MSDGTSTTESNEMRSENKYSKWQLIMLMLKINSLLATKVYVELKITTANSTDGITLA